MPPLTYNLPSSTPPDYLALQSRRYRTTDLNTFAAAGCFKLSVGSDWPVQKAKPILEAGTGATFTATSVARNEGRNS